MCTRDFFAECRLFCWMKNLKFPLSNVCTLPCWNLFGLHEKSLWRYNWFSSSVSYPALGKADNLQICLTEASENFALNSHNRLRLETIKTPELCDTFAIYKMFSVEKAKKQFDLNIFVHCLPRQCNILFESYPSIELKSN